MEKSIFKRKEVLKMKIMEVLKTVGCLMWNSIVQIPFFILGFILLSIAKIFLTVAGIGDLLHVGFAVRLETKKTDSYDRQDVEKRRMGFC